MAQSNRVVAIEECWLPDQALDDAWKQLSFEAGLDIERISLRSSDEGEISIMIAGGITDLPDIELDAPYNLIHQSPAGELVIAGSPISTITIHDRVFQVSAGSFFQINPQITAELVRCVLNEITDKKYKQILDLYCGVGLFSFFAAPCAEHLIGIESSSSACADFAANLDEFDHVDLYEGKTEEILPSLEINSDLVIVDPPRAGLEKVVVEKILATEPEKVIYISCDPSTFARDSQILTGNDYKLSSVTLLDMFPQTYHFETMGVFVLGSISA